MKEGIMGYENILEDINDVKERLYCAYNRWNELDDSYIIEESIWAIKALEIQLNNLYAQAKLIVKQ
jgi:hypothetical protein